MMVQVCSLGHEMEVVGFNYGIKMFKYNPHGRYKSQNTAYLYKHTKIGGL